MSCVTYTFIIPHNNSKKLLSRCLASIPHRKDIEIIVVDDNSREEERPQQEREDEQILYIDAANSKGAGRARNEGMKIAKGRWLVFADCDDFFNKGFMNVLDQYKDSNKDVVYYNADYVDSKTLMPIIKHPIPALNYFERYNGSKYSEDCVKYKIHAPWAKMVRRQFICEYHISFEEIPKGNDVFFTFQIGYFSKKIAIEKKKLYVYTYNSNSLSNKKKDYITYIGVLKRIFKRNEFYYYIGYKKWKDSIVKFWLKILKKDGVIVFFQTLLYYFKNHSAISNQKYYYVNTINSIKNLSNEKN